MCAFGVVDNHRHAQERNQRETHGHAVVVVSVDCRIGREHGRWRDVDGFRLFHHRSAHFAQFCRHRGNAVGFFHTPRADIAQRAGRACGQRHHRQRHRRIGNVVGIQIKRAHRLPSPARHFDKIIAPNHVCTDFFQFVRKGHIALNTVAADAGYADGRTREQAGGKKIRGARSIAFHMQHFGGMVVCAGRQPEYLIIFVFHLHTELRHQFQSDVDIRLGNQFAHHADFKGFAGERQGHQQSGEKLARHIAFNRNHARALIAAPVDLQRRIAFFAQILHIGARNVQRIHQVANRALVHARHAVQPVIAAKHRQRRRERAKSRAGVAEK